MAQVDSTSFDAALKEFYSDEYVRNTVYENNPLFAMLEKYESWTGDNYVQPVQIGISSASRSADITVSLARKDTNKYRKFVVTDREDYNAISIGRKVMKQSGNNRGAFFEARTREIDGMLQALTNSASSDLYRNGGGARGQVNASGPSTTTFTLLEIEDVVNFEVGMNLCSSDNDGSTTTDTLHNSGATAVISAVNRDTGVITSSSNWTAQIASLGANDYLFAEGDFDASNGGGKIQGLQAWIPNSAPSATTFNNVDRTVDVTRLAGHRVTGTNMTIREALRLAAARIGREGGAADTVMMSHQKYNDLVTELDNKVQYVETGTDVEVGFTGIKLVGFKKPITVYADHNCPDGRAFMINKADWKIISYGPIPDLHDEDGVRMLREGNSDGFEVRASYYANLVPVAPKSAANISLE